MAEKACMQSANKLGVTIARKVLPHPQGMKGMHAMHNLLNKGLFI